MGGVGIIQQLLSDRSEIPLKINWEKISTCMDMKQHASNQQMNGEVSVEALSSIEPNESERETNPDLWDTVKVALRGKSITYNADNRKRTKDLQSAL